MYLTREQKLYKSLIKADMKLVLDNYDNKDKAVRLQAAYHMQQAVEKTIKLKAEIKGLNLWGHEIDILIRKCDEKGIDIDVPKYIQDKADIITHWEAECRYYPVSVVRRDTIKKIYDIVLEWLNSGETK